MSDKSEKESARKIFREGFQAKLTEANQLRRWLQQHSFNYRHSQAFLASAILLIAAGILTDALTADNGGLRIICGAAVAIGVFVLGYSLKRVVERDTLVVAFYATIWAASSAVFYVAFCLALSK